MQIESKNKKVLLVIFALLLIAGISYIAWSKSHNQTGIKNISSGISGIVLLGPTCPVVMDPPHPACADKPYKTDLMLTTADQSHIITKFSSDTDGKFSVKVGPGEYAIRSTAAANILPYCSHDALKVEKDKFTNITVSCDTGIR